MPIKITVEESDDKAEKTTLQTPNGKSKNRDNTTLQTPKGTENEELPPAEPLAIPDDDELKPVDTIVIKDGETYKNVKVYEVKKQAKEQEGAKCQFCKGTGKVIVEKKGIKECPRCEGEGYTTKPQADLENHKDDQQIDDITQEEEIQGGIQPETEEQIEQDNSENEMEDFQEEQEPEDLDFGEPEEEKVNTKAFESFVGKKIQVLKQRHPDKAVTLLMGTEVNGDYGSKKIKGTLAYAGVSLNDRIYLPEELAKGDGMTLPLLLNHSSTAGAEGELYRLQEDARQSLERGQDYKVGEVTLTWKPEALTLYYEGEVDNPFFQKEVDEADMAVSLGIYYDSDSPMLCNDQCYTVIKGAEFREVSLVYHAGFPVATIEAYEKLLKQKAMESMKGEPNINPEKANEYYKDGSSQYNRAYNFTIDQLMENATIMYDGKILHDTVFNYMENIEGEEFKDPEYLNDDAVYQAVGDAINWFRHESGESKASEVNYDYNEIKGGGTWVEYHGYDGRTGKPDGSVKKGKAWLKGPAGWVVGNGSSNTDFVDESNFISSESKANELSPEAQCPKCGSYKTILEGKSSLGYGKRRQYACLNCYNIFQSEHSPKEIRAMYGDHNSPYDRNRWGESKADELEPRIMDYLELNSGKIMCMICDNTFNSKAEFREHYYTHSTAEQTDNRRASEWTPSQGHDWQPPTDKDYKDLPKPEKNQKVAGSHDEPDFSKVKQDGRNRNTDGKFSKEKA